jgi:hypothetical protein
MLLANLRRSDRLSHDLEKTTRQLDRVKRSHAI